MTTQKVAFRPRPPRIAPGFAERLRFFDLEALAERATAIYAVDADLRLAYLNPAWFRFSDENGGATAIDRYWDLGRNVLDACAPLLRPFYEAAYGSAMVTGETWEHDFECSAPDVYRIMHQTAYPLPDGGGLLIVNAEVVSSAHDPDARPEQPAIEARYRDEHGLIRQCCHCRMTRRQGAEDRWDWIPEWVAESPKRTSHGLCAPCRGHYYQI
jgi:hypothetical protein